MAESTSEKLSNKFGELLLEDLDQKTKDIISEFKQNFAKQFERLGKLLVDVLKDKFNAILSDDEDGPDILRKFHSMLDEEGTNFKNTDHITIIDDCAEQVEIYLSGWRKNAARILAHIIKTNGSYRSQDFQNFISTLKGKRKDSGKMPYFSLINELNTRLSPYIQEAISSQRDKLESLLEKTLPKNQRDVKTLKSLPISTQSASQPSELILEPKQLFQVTGECTSIELDVRSERVENMKKRVIQKNTTDYEYNKFSCSVQGEECSICLSKFVDGENVRYLHCEHLFHSSCIDSWLIHGCVQSMICPFCRSKVA